VAQAPKDQGAIAARDEAGKGTESLSARPAAAPETAPTAPSIARYRSDKPGEPPQPSAMPAESSPSDAAAAGAPAEGTAARRSIAKTSPEPGTIVCTVTPAFLEDDSFTKLAEKMSVKVAPSGRRRSLGAEFAENRQEQAAVPLQKSDESPKQVAYVVQATDAQLAKFIDALKASSVTIAKAGERQISVAEQDAAQTESDRARSYRFVLQLKPDAPSAAGQGEP
jgi:hypothetical protein